MQITVFGASGKVGRQIVGLALGKGWQVTAFVHHSNPFTPHQNLTIIPGELDDIAAVTKAVTGSEAVVSTLGSWHTKSKNILTAGMRSIIPAMEERGVQRLVTLTGAGAFWPGDKPSTVDQIIHRLLGLAAPQILHDGEEHLRLLAASSLDWTTVRSPVMTKRSSTGYRLTSELAPPWAGIARAAVVQCIIDQLEKTDWHRQAPIIRAD